MNRRTFLRAATRDGLGLHSGETCTLTLNPAPFGTGLVFRTSAGAVPVTLDHAHAVPGATVLACGAARVSTPEHLLAALHALGVTDGWLDLDGPELPALDGSAQMWVEAIDEAGRVEGDPVVVWRPDRWVAVHQADGTARIGPGRTIGVEVDFGVDGPRGSLSGPLDEHFFRAEVAWARTFVRAEDIHRLRAAGRGRGANDHNTRVWPGPGPSDEPVRHKLLDAWGDLALLGPVEAALHVVRGSHQLHLAALRAANDRTGLTDKNGGSRGP